MIEELEMYLEELWGNLDVEVDLHGSRTRMAHDLRTLILKTEKEIERLKTEVLGNGITRNQWALIEGRLP